MKINSISSMAANYPYKLAEISDPPAKLYYRGKLPDKQATTIAIIGTRKPTAYGIAVTQQLAHGLASRGAIIISGLALGIDSIAHKACLDGGGITAAVLPAGVDKPYPRTHTTLADRIIDSGGCLISEYPVHTEPRKHHFLARNRLVSGLSDAVIVTEASQRSGTMSTVAHALSQGKDVYAVPGPITSPQSRGCNQLIAQGATPIVDVNDFLDIIAPQQNEMTTHAYSQNELIIIKLIKQGVGDGDELLSSSQLDAAVFQQTMTLMEIRGSIHALGANQWRL